MFLGVPMKLDGNAGNPMNFRRYLTKSRFKLTRECPTKLFYMNKTDQFEDKSLDDSFLKALADGGFQIGELAKLYHPGGVNIETLDHEKALAETNELLLKDQVIIFEAAIRYNKLFIRTDILIKNGNRIDLIEVKAKSFDSTEEDKFYDRRFLKKGSRRIVKKWKPYLEDVAFQTYIAQNAHPTFKFTPYLMMADKSKTASVDGLNQRFLLNKDEAGRTRVKIKEGTNLETVSSKILCKIDVREEVDLILCGEDGQSLSLFALEVQGYADSYETDAKIEPKIGNQCKKCQFRSNDITRSGFHQCWKEKAKLKDQELVGPFVFEVWNFRKAQEQIESGIFLMKDLAPEVINLKTGDEPGLSSSERQWKQVELSAKGIKDPYVDKTGLVSEMASWNFPLHFIDFETTMVAIPFNKNRRPYEQMVFQFSHHQIEKDGTISHKGQYLSREVGIFPNFDFIRALKKRSMAIPVQFFVIRRMKILSFVKYMANSKSLLNRIEVN